MATSHWVVICTFSDAKGVVLTENKLSSYGGLVPTTLTLSLAGFAVL